MKTKYYVVLPILIACFLVTACQKDNYTAPSSQLKGRIVYQGSPLNFGSGDVYFELWQPGFGKSGAITVNVDENGNYASLLFNGDYKLVIPPSQGPFISNKNATTGSDTIPVTVNGNQDLDIEVLPYYLFKNANITMQDSIVTAKFDIEQILVDTRAKSIESVTLYLNKGILINGTAPVFKSVSFSELNSDLTNNVIALKASFSQSYDAATGNQNYVYAALGLKVTGVDDMLFTPVQKLSF